MKGNIMSYIEYPLTGVMHILRNRVIEERNLSPAEAGTFAQRLWVAVANRIIDGVTFNTLDEIRVRLPSTLREVSQRWDNPLTSREAKELTDYAANIRV